MEKILLFFQKFIERIMKNKLFIYQRIIIIQIAFVLVLMIIFGIISYFTSRSKEVKQMTIQTEQLKVRLASNLSISLWNFDSNSCEKLIMQEIQDKYVLAVLINQNNKFLMGKIKSDKDAVATIDDINKHQEVLKGSFAVKSQKVMYKDTDSVDKEIGELVVYITDSYISSVLTSFLIQTILQTIILIVILSFLTYIIINLFLDKPLKQIIQTAKRIAAGETELQADTNGPVEIATLAIAFNSMTTQLSNKAEEFKKASEESNRLAQDFKQASEEAKRTNEILKEVIAKAKEIIVNLNSSSKEIEAAAQEQTSGANEHASGITEVSATLEELTITAKQITKNVGELVLSSEEVIKLLEESEERLLHTVSQLEEVGRISTTNTSEIGELGKRSVIINEMVELIKEVANKTDMLSINASIEAARSGEAGAGFSVVASEIRELSKETINSAKNVEKAAKEIQDFIKSIIVSSETESEKVLDSGKVVTSIYDNMQSIGSKINNNYSFTQKIDVSIKQQESGSRQAADTMKQMAEISRQSAETARQTSLAVKDIVNFSTELDDTVKKVKLE